MGVKFFYFLCLTQRVACLALAEKSGIGRVVALSRDFPPEGVWNNHHCCVLVASRDLLQNHPEMAMAVSAIPLSGGNYAQEHPEDLPETAADWLMGGRDYLRVRNENRLSFYIKQFR